MAGIYVLDGADIISGKKTIIASPEQRNIEGERVLVVKTEDGGKVVGVITLSEAKSVDAKEFDSFGDKHCISPKNRMRWWPGRRRFFLYEVKRFEPFGVPMSIDIPPGIGMNVDISVVDVSIIKLGRRGDKHMYLIKEEDGITGIDNAT